MAEADANIEPAVALDADAVSTPRISRRRWRGLRGLILPVLLLAIWESLSRFGVVPVNLLPAPSLVLWTLWNLAAAGHLAVHIGITLERVALGFLAGAAAATLLGALTGYSARWREVLDPTLQSLRAIPSIAWVPLFVLWLGIFEASKIALIALGAFFPVYLELMSGIEHVDRKLVEVGRMYGMSGATLVRRVLLPATLPYYLVGLRGGLGLGWMFVIAAELMGASSGLGYLLVEGQETSRPAVIIASILLFAIFGKLTDLALERLGRRFLGWQDSFRAAQERQADAPR
ncbi:MAG TPA: ABC transporter permease [Candidatus Cybelea sp.]|nr:ABC transporter permease [Candidatus Cybelea sp.]